MQRVPEPELMSDEDQAMAYANADFEEPHNHFISLLKYKRYIYNTDMVNLNFYTI